MRAGAMALLLVFLLVLNAQAGGLLDYREPDSGTQVAATLYFRYLDSPFLGQEARVVQVPRTQNLGQALVQALLDGPQGAEGLYTPLFPAGTQVLNVLEEEGRLFVSFSKEVLNPLLGEAATGPEAQTRRRLALSSLANTLIEATRAHSVQVLVLAEPGPSQSLRLSARFLLEDSDLPLSPLTRNESDVLSPGAACQSILGFWQQKRWSTFLKLLAPDANTGFTMEDLAKLPEIRSLEATPGVIAPDGAAATVNLDLELLTRDGKERNLVAFPVMMLRAGQGWRLSHTSLLALLEAAR